MFFPGFVTDSFWWRVTRSDACVTNLPGERFQVQRNVDQTKVRQEVGKPANLTVLRG